MAEAKTVSDIKSVTIEAVVIRADGTKEDLGVVSEWHKEDEEKEESE